MSLMLLVRRHLRTAAGAVLALAAVTVLAAGTLSTVPRAVAAVHADQLAHVTAQTSALTSDVVATTPVFPGYGEDYDAYGGVHREGPADGEVDPPVPDLDGYLAGLRDLAAARPAPLSGVLGEPDLVVAADRTGVERVEGNDVAAPGIVLQAGPSASAQVQVVEGRWPAATPVPADPTAMLPGSDGVVEFEPTAMEVAVSTAVAAELDWALDSVHATDEPLLPPLHVVGLWEPQDADADYWAHVPRTTTPEIVFDPNIGKIVTAGVFADPATLGSWVPAPSARVWFPVDTSGVAAQDAPALLAQLRGLTATTTTVVDGDSAVLEPATGLLDVLETALGQRAGVDAIVTVLAVGPLGALAAVLVLAAGLVVDRRRATLALARARGASMTWVRGVVALEGLVVGLPAAALGFAAGLAVVPGTVTSVQVGAAVLCGLGPALVLAAVTPAAGLRAGRADLGAVPARRRHLRLGVEAGVVLAAAGTSWLAVDRGVVAATGSSTGPTGTGSGVDPLLAVAPLLVGVAVALVTFRLVPPVARAVERLAARGSGLVPFLGAARVRRDPAGGPLPAVALVLAVGVALSSVVLSGTVRQGVTDEAWAEVGGDLRVAGPVVDGPTADSLRGIDGVAAVAPVADAGRFALGRVGSGSPVTAWTTDAAELARVQQDVPGAPDGLDRLAATDDGRLPVVAVGFAAGQVTDGQVLSGPGGARTEVVVVDRVDALPGLPPSSGALLVDATAAGDRVGIAPGTARLALVGLTDAADAEAPDPAPVEAEIGALLPTAVVDDPREGEQALLSSPAAAGLATAFTVAVALSALLCVATVTLMLVLATPARTRVLAVLRTLGLPRRAERGLVAWEVGPWAVAALLAGGVVGVLVPALVLAVVDLTPLTGGAASPALVVDPWGPAALAGGLLVAVVAGTLVAGSVGRRRGAETWRTVTD
ncbi:FtsX-like permease family protein [Isoptericola sp. AK164]|uniref:FtsX-like permease family protein n=1 Tax=Isoptericola sp. AK164 TaxID=3024246 RepID=UPI0024187CAA|nr:FtsX-like permease family protein [Isoptericola sp. AK164]